MTKRLSFLLLCMVALMISCSKKKAVEKLDATLEHNVGYKAKNDSTLYGLACEGCTDSVLVIMHDDCTDPVTYDIIQARKDRRILGQPAIGDRIAFMISPNNKREIVFAVDIDQMYGSWIYELMPTLREESAISDKEHTLSDTEKAERDSLAKVLMVPRECGMILKQDFTSQPIGRQWRQNTLDEESPVVYPEVKFYSEWHIFNGQLILTMASMPQTGKTKKQPTTVVNDTARLLMLSRDTLVLRFKDHTQGYSRKKNELNKK